MAIPATPINFIAQQGNLQAYLEWNLSVGALTYTLQRSTDQVTYSTIATITAINYLDTTVSTGIEYFYQVAATNASGTSPYSAPQSIIVSPTAEMSLGQLRLMSQQKADMVNSQFITTSEWNNWINLAMFELYDLLIDTDPDLFTTTPVQFTTTGGQQLYPLPNGVLYSAAAPFYKLMGVDLNLNTSANAWVTVSRFNFIDRNKWIYPNTSSTAYGPFNLQYRLVGNQIEFIPAPTSNQTIQLWYCPRLAQLLKDTDISNIGYSGWLQYVIVRAAKYGLDKQMLPSDTLTQEIMYIKQRIEDSVATRDVGRPDTISDTRSWGTFGDGTQAGGIFRGGW